MSKAHIDPFSVAGFELQPDSTEQSEITDEFSKMLRLATGDGANKRQRGEKPLWKVDPSHEAAMYRHLDQWEGGELYSTDSGVHHLVSMAWRALAIAWREMH
jgi:hypothetical protein